MENFAFLWLRLFLLAVCLQSAFSGNEMELFFENCSCTALDTSGVLKHLACSLTKANRQKRTFNMEMQFNRNVDKLRIDMLVTLPQKGQQPKQQQQLFGNLNLVLLNISRLNACAIFTNRNSRDMIQWLRKPLLHYSNFPQRCPLVQQKMYFIRGLRFDAQLLPQVPMSNILQIDFMLADENLKLFKGVTRLHYGPNNERRG